MENPSLLLPIESVYDSRYAYFVYPFYNTLSQIILSDSLSFQYIREFARDIGNAILSLHQEKICHYDITFQNIFIDKENHFYLGDFSSANFAILNPLHSIYYSNKYQRSGTTCFVFPSEANICSSLPYYPDYYAFVLLLFVMLHGKMPTKNYVSDNVILRDIDDILIHILYPKTKKIPDMKTILQDLEREFTRYEEQLQSFSFCNSSATFIKEDTLDISYGKIKLSYRKWFQKWKNSVSVPVPVYGLLFLCCCIFLFSFYRALTNKSKQAQTLSNNYFAVAATSSAVKKTALPQAATSHAFHFDLPSNTPNSTGSKTKDILNISNHSYQNNSFLHLIQDMHQLKILFAGNNLFQNDKPFACLANLEELYLNDNSISFLSELPNLKKLRILNLSNNKLKDISSLKTLSSLTMLDLSHNKHLTNIETLSSLKTLQYLILTNTNVTKKQVQTLQKCLPLCTILF